MGKRRGGGDEENGPTGGGEDRIGERTREREDGKLRMILGDTDIFLSAWDGRTKPPPRLSLEKTGPLMLTPCWRRSGRDKTPRELGVQEWRED